MPSQTEIQQQITARIIEGLKTASSRGERPGSPTKLRVPPQTPFLAVTTRA